MFKEKIDGYALALFALGNEEKKLKTVKNDANVIIDVISQNEGIIRILSSKTLDHKIKNNLVDEAFNKININIKNFIKIIINRGLGVYISPVLKKLIKLVNQKENIKEGVIYTTEKLTPARIASLEKKVATILGYKPILKNKIDATLIAGFRIIVEDEIIEDSVVSRLEHLKNKILGRED